MALTPMTFTVTIEDCREDHAGKIYQCRFTALTRFDAIAKAVDALVNSHTGLIEGRDFVILDAR